MNTVLIDANLLLLLIVGSADRRYISMHKNLSSYSEYDFDVLGQLISLYSDIVVLPHVLTELSSLSRQIKSPAKLKIQEKLKEFIEAVPEIMLPSLNGARHDQFFELGLTDAVILQLCALSRNGLDFSLLTNDRDLAVQAEILGYDVQYFMHWR